MGDRRKTRMLRYCQRRTECGRAGRAELSTMAVVEAAAGVA